MAFLSSSTLLNANDTVTLGPTLSDRADRIVGSAFSDQAGTLYIEQSFDGTNWDISTSITITASDGKGFSEELVAPNIRLRYTNGGTNQGEFRLFARFSSAGSD